MAGMAATVRPAAPKALTALRRDRGCPRSAATISFFFMMNPPEVARIECSLRAARRSDSALGHLRTKNRPPPRGCPPDARRSRALSRSEAAVAAGARVVSRQADRITRRQPSHGQHVAAVHRIECEFAVREP